MTLEGGYFILSGMDSKETVIDFSLLREYIKKRGLKVAFISEKAGIHRDRLSQIYRNLNNPKTDLLAKICYVLKAPASQIVSFKINTDEKKQQWFKDKELPYSPPEDAEGVLTYEPLRIMMNMYLDYYADITGKDKTVNDLFDMIEPYRRRNGIKNGLNDETRRKGLIARGFAEDYKSERTDRKYKAKGLTPETRSKLKNDKPVNIRTIYDICNFFGCSIDWVMSYK